MCVTPPNNHCIFLILFHACSHCVFFRYREVQFECRLSCDPWKLPKLVVALTTEKCIIPKHHLAVRQEYRNGLKRDFSVCLDGVLKHNISTINNIIDWTELNILLGAEHFCMYNFSASTLLDPYFSHYRQKQLFTVLPWNLPIQFDNTRRDYKLIWNYGQDVMLHDCLYRHMLVSRNLVYIDLDEFIIPQDPDDCTWLEMMEHAKLSCPENPGSYSAKHALFNTKLVDTNINVKTLRHMSMYNKLYQQNIRSKYILVPERVTYIGIHYISEFWNGSYKSCELPRNIGLLQHYREKVWKLDINTTLPNTAILKYKDNLINNINTFWLRYGTHIP